MADKDGAPVPSPCIDVCSLDESSGLCMGCHRTMEEIAAWSYMSDDEKREVLGVLDLRKMTRNTLR